MIGTLEERFWAKVDKNGPIVRADLGPCWQWTACKDPKTGMAIFKIPGRSGCSASRVSWLLTFGEEPTENVLHKCDNTSCVNPEHFFAGTQKDNVADCVSKNRRGDARGSHNSQSKLTEDDVIDMRVTRALGATYAALGRAFRVSRVLARKVCLGHAWPHVKEGLLA